MGDEDSSGCFCYFQRDLMVGLAGADVSCLQQYLKKEGHFNTKPTGYFGTATEEALSSWQMANNLLPAKGILGYSSRVTYAKRHKIPTAEQLKAMENKAVCETKKVSMCHDIEATSFGWRGKHAGSQETMCRSGVWYYAREPILSDDHNPMSKAAAKRRNIEGYSSVGAEEVFYSRKAMFDASREDMLHLCQEACQTATSEACDKTFPDDESGPFRHCLNLVPKNCKLTCEKNMST